MIKTNRNSHRRQIGLACLFVLGLSFMAGCESDAQIGTLLGAGIGALAGNAIGGDTGATVIGTAVGAGLGYVIGNESDKQRYEERHDSTYRGSASTYRRSDGPSHRGYGRRSSHHDCREYNQWGRHRFDHD